MTVDLSSVIKSSRVIFQVCTGAGCRHSGQRHPDVTEFSRSRAASQKSGKPRTAERDRNRNSGTCDIFPAVSGETPEQLKILVSAGATTEVSISAGN